MAATAESQQLSNAILSFALEGSFPEDAAALHSVSETDLNPTIEALGKAKLDIEVHIASPQTSLASQRVLTEPPFSRPRYTR